MTALAACTLPRGAALQNEITRGDPDAAAFQVVQVGRDNIAALGDWPVTGWAGQYRWLETRRGPASALIRTGDKVSVTIWDSQESSLLTTPAQRNVILPEMTVSASGTVFLPYVDEVVVRGLTPADARRRLQSALEAIVPSAQVQLQHMPGHQNTVNAVRGFDNPGSYPMPDRNYSILTLIAEAGGISTELRNPVIRLIREGDTFEIRAKTLLETASRNVTLRGGDKVIVDEDDRSFIALGATGREEQVYFDQDYLTVLEALAQVGGLSDARANLQGVLILREYPARALKAAKGPEKAQVIFVFDLTSADGLFAARKFQINPDDVVIASESPVTSLRTIFGLAGSAIGLGNALDNN